MQIRRLANHFNFRVNKRWRVNDFRVQSDKTLMLPSYYVYVAIAAFDAKGHLMIRSQFSTMDNQDTVLVLEVFTNEVVWGMVLLPDSFIKLS